MKLKKPKFWDNKHPNFISYILLPLTFPFIINNFFLKFKKKIYQIKELRPFALEIYTWVVLQKLLSQSKFIKF